jgi:hypothetical protein
VIEIGEKRVVQIVENTRGIRSWIRSRIEAGWTDEQIAEVLPVATKFITGRMTEAELRQMVAAA